VRSERIQARGRMAGRSRHGLEARATAFTIVELLFSLAIIFLLMGLMLVGFRAVSRGSQAAAERQAVAGLKLGVEQFRQEFHILPPLVRDTQPLSGDSPAVFDFGDDQDRRFLSTRGVVDNVGNPDNRFSVYSLPYYLMGALDGIVDGVDGPGFLEAKRDGSFRKSGGRTYDPMFDPKGNANAVYIEDVATGKAYLRDRKGNSYRYYRWVRGDNNANYQVIELDDLNVPQIVGDPAADGRLKSAEFAIVGAGRNGVFGDLGTEDPNEVRIELGMSVNAPLPKVQRIGSEDNIVEVGQ